MKDKLIIVVDLGLLKAYRIDVTPQKIRRLEQLQEIVLEEARTRLKDRVTDLIQQNAKNGCWLAAPKEINLQLLNELSPAVRQRIQKSVPCDFTKLSPPEVLEHFLDRATL